jgi:hypothetical protein
VSSPLKTLRDRRDTHLLKHNKPAITPLSHDQRSIVMHRPTCLLCLRYYGQSKPWGADVRKHMAYLTAEQALAGDMT